VTLAAVAAAIGAVAAMSAWSALAPAPAVREQLVVIQREPAGAAAAATTASAAPPVAPQNTPAELTPSVQATAETAHSAAITVATTAKPERTAATAAVPDPRALTHIFGRKQARVEACFHKYQAALAGLPEVSLHFRVDEAGEVAEATLSPPDFASTALGACLLDVARSTHFGALRNGVAFRIPLSVEKIAKTSAP
jgi:hypothetical protein